MKQLEQLTNVDRAKLLHELFPGQIEGFIEWAVKFAEYTETNREKLAETWDNKFFTFDAWCSLASDAKHRMQQYTKRLSKNSKLFADQLFDSYTVLWSVDALIKYVNRPEFTYGKFKDMINVLFGYERES